MGRGSCANSLRLLDHCRSVSDIGGIPLERYGNRKALTLAVHSRDGWSRRVKVGRKTTSGRGDTAAFAVSA